jgi:NTE family protein
VPRGSAGPDISVLTLPGHRVLVHVSQPLARRRAVAPRTVLLVAMVGVFMAFLDNTIVTIAFPNLQRSFPDSTLGSLSWVFNIYNIALAALLVPAGMLADALGRKRMFVAGIALFTLASAICAAAQSVGVLIAARALQGSGAALIVPSSLGLVLHAYPQRKRAQAVAIWTATGALAAGIGPSIGGLLVVASSWRLVFVINIPLGAVGWWLARRELVESRAPGRRVLPDLGGALLLAVAVGLLVLAIVQGQTWHWANVRTLATLIGALAAGAWLLRRSLRHPAPMLDLELIGAPGFAVTSVLTVIGAAGFYGLALLNIFYLIDVWRFSALTAGLAGTPAPFVAAAVAVVAGRLVAKRDSRPLIVLGAVIWALGPLILVERFATSSNYLLDYLPAALVLAVGIGIVFPLVSDIAASLAPRGRHAGATAMNSSLRQVGAAIGVAVIVVVVGHPRPDQVHDAFLHGWFFASVCFSVVAIGALALRRVQPEPRSASLIKDVREILGHPVTAPAPPARPRRASSSVIVPTRTTPPVPGESTEDFLKAVPLFAALSGDEIAAVAQRASTLTLPAGAWLFHQGDVADAMYVVRSGRVQAVEERPDGTLGIIRELRAGAPVGELAMIRRSRRTVGVRVRRDAALLRLDGAHFEDILRSSPSVSRALLDTLAAWLSSNSRPRPARPKPPATIAVVSLDADASGQRIEWLLEQHLRQLARTVRLSCPEATATEADPGHALAELLDRAEHEYDHVLLTGEGFDPASDWTQACMRQADRVVLLVSTPPEPERLREWCVPSGSDVVLLGGASDLATGRLLRALEPRASHRVRPATRVEDVARLARRLAGRSVGLSLSGGGARCFAQIGVIEELAAAGITIDRVSGTSMGAFISALVAQGLEPAEIDARCYEEWVRRNPVNDYRFPRMSLIRGARARTMLERVFPDCIEDLKLGFFCVTVDLIAAKPVYHRRGALADAVGASMILPGFAPPLASEGRLLVDGGLMDNLPTEVMASEGDGPIIAVDCTDPSVRQLPDGVDPELPTLPETLFKVMLLSESDSDRRRSFADLLIRPDCSDIGTIEFHMLDAARERGRRAASAALRASTEFVDAITAS